VVSSFAPGTKKITNTTCTAIVWVYVLPLVQITMWSGVSADVKKKLVEEITAAFERQGIPKEAVSIIIYEVPKEN